MNEIVKDVVGVAMAIVGVALLYTLVNPNNKTAQVISTSSQGFAYALSAAMGGNVSAPSVGGF